MFVLRTELSTFQDCFRWIAFGFPRLHSSTPTLADQFHGFNHVVESNQIGSAIWSCANVCHCCRWIEGCLREERARKGESGKKTLRVFVTLNFVVPCPFPLSRPCYSLKFALLVAHITCLSNIDTSGWLLFWKLFCSTMVNSLAVDSPFQFSFVSPRWLQESS